MFPSSDRGPIGVLLPDSHRQAQKARPKRPAQFPGRGPEAPGRGPAQFLGPPWAGPRPGPVFSRPAQFPGLRPRAQGPPLPHAELPAQRPLCKSKRGVWVKSYARRKVACFAPEFGSKNPPRKVRFGGAHKILSGGPLLRCAFPENCSSQRTQPWRFSKPRSPPWMSGQNLGVSMQKNHTKIGVAWGSVVLNGPQRVKNFFL